MTPIAPRTLPLLALLALLAACGDGQPVYPDRDGDGIPDNRDDNDDTVLDTDGDGIPDSEDTDDDGDGIPDDQDPDDDGDGILDEDELGGGDGDYTGGGGVGPLPADISSALTDVDYDEANGTLDVTVRSLDTTPVTARYRRNAALDVPGYDAYSVQEDPLDRMFVALVQTSADGSVTGGTVMDGGQFNRFFGGAFYERTGAYSPHSPSQPDRGLVSYAGHYAGLTNIAAGRPGEILPVPPGTDPALVPDQPGRVTGDVFINADFADNTVNGAVVDRRHVDLGLDLPDVVLIVSDITADGTFLGEAEDDELRRVGTYSGAFGGQGATAVAGGLHIEDFVDDIDNEEEFGSFVLMQCGQPGDAAICDDVDP